MVCLVNIYPPYVHILLEAADGSGGHLLGLPGHFCKQTKDTCNFQTFWVEKKISHNRGALLSLEGADAIKQGAYSLHFKNGSFTPKPKVALASDPTVFLL